MRSSWRERRACCGYLNQGRGLSPLPSGEDNDAQLFAQTRTLRIRQLNGFDLSIVESTSPLRAVASIPLTDFHGVSRARGPKRQLSKQPAFQFGQIVATPLWPRLRRQDNSQVSSSRAMSTASYVE